MFQNPKTYWVWSKYTESINNTGKFPDTRIAGEEVPAVRLFGGMEKGSCPKSWVNKGYVVDATEFIKELV